MKVLKICRKCSKPASSDVDGKARSGKSLLKRLQELDDLPFEVKACKCLGHCKQGPNGIVKPGDRHLHHLSVKEVKRLAKKV